VEPASSWHHWQTIGCYDGGVSNQISRAIFLWIIEIIHDAGGLNSAAETQLRRQAARGESLWLPAVGMATGLRSGRLLIRKRADSVSDDRRQTRYQVVLTRRGRRDGTAAGYMANFVAPAMRATLVLQLPRRSRGSHLALRHSRVGHRCPTFGQPARGPLRADWAEAARRNSAITVTDAASPRCRQHCYVA
jgi:hypothetical protein